MKFTWKKQKQKHSYLFEDEILLKVILLLFVVKFGVIYMNSWYSALF